MGEGEKVPIFCPYIYFLFINNSIGDYLFYIGYLYNVYSVFFLKKMIKRVFSKVFRDIPINKSVRIIVKRSLPPIYIYIWSCEIHKWFNRIILRGRKKKTPTHHHQEILKKKTKQAISNT